MSEILTCGPPLSTRSSDGLETHDDVSKGQNEQELCCGIVIDIIDIQIHFSVCGKRKKLCSGHYNVLLESKTKTAG